MKIIWVTNIPVGRHSEITNCFPVIGGWMTSTLDLLKEYKSIDLCVVTTWPIKKRTELKEGNVQYVVLPGGYPINYRLNRKKNIKEWKELVFQFKPDLIHIHGTEFSPGLTLMLACPNVKYIISIQGLCGVIERYYYAGIDISDIIRNITIRDILRHDSIIQARLELRKRGKRELEYLSKTNHVIGRTTWDLVHTKSINNNIQYHYCNETLRSAFYNKSWQIGTIKRHKIFVSQSEYPIKGLHLVLKACNILKRDYNDLELYVAGTDITKTDSLYKKIKINGYGKYLRGLIKNYSLEGSVFFTGNLDSEEMATYYLNSHVFVCPSSIENSPNSLGEAQLIGIPCVASYVGGIPDMVTDGVSGLLYRFEEYELLANKIKCVFDDDILAIRLSSNEKITASTRHNRKQNLENILSIYNKLL